MITLPKGSKEFLVVVVADRLNQITDLITVGVNFSVVNQSGTEVISNVAAQVDGMTALCLVDTTGFTEGLYELFVTIDAPPQKPVLGPFKFAVEDYEGTP